MNLYELAAAIASYETDEPHWFPPNMPEKKDSGYYPEFSVEEFKKYLSEDHCGDCTNVPAACIRCYCEGALHKANWILARLGISGYQE